MSRKLFFRSELSKLILSSLISKNYKLHDKIYFSRLFNKYGKKSSLSMSRNYCHHSGKGRSVFKLFKINRHELKKTSSYGQAMGMRKSSF